MAAVEVAENLPEIAKSPEWKTNPLNVEEAEAKRLVREERPLTAREEEAERAPPTLSTPWKVEEGAVENIPPRELM